MEKNNNFNNKNSYKNSQYKDAKRQGPRVVKPTDPKKPHKVYIPAENKKCGYVEYKMSQQMAQSFISNREGNINDINEYLCNIVNKNFGLLGHCIRVIIE